MIVSNTSPINYLVQIEAIDWLGVLFGSVNVPASVVRELSDPAAPKPVREWVASPPDWLRVHDDPPQIRPALRSLHVGEAAAIELSLNRRAGLLLIDDLDGRVAARDLGITVMGTLGVMDAIASRGAVAFSDLLGRLRKTNFRAPRRLVEALLARHGDEH